MHHDHDEALRAAYRLRHRLRAIGAWLDAESAHGPLCGPVQAAYLLAVDPSRVRRLVRAGRLPSVSVHDIELIPVRSLLSAPTPCERGRPRVFYPDGSRRRDDGGHDGLRLPLPVIPDYVERARKKADRTPGRNIGRGK
jgi:hypothetical protein